MALSNKMLVNLVSIFWPSSIKLRKLAAEGKGSLEAALPPTLEAATELVAALVAEAEAALETAGGGAGREKSALDKDGNEAKGSEEDGG